LVAGRDFSRQFVTDSNESFILNETAVHALNWANPAEALGSRIWCDGKTGRVIGVVRDFHFNSLHSRIEPTILHVRPERYYQITALIGDGRISEVLSSFKDIWKEVFHNRPFEYSFLDDNLAAQYHADQNMNRLLGYFTILSIFVTCLGLLALTAFTAQKSTKEIGIRRVLGASPLGIALLLSRKLLIWIFLANIIAWPIAFFAMERWLQNFAYRIDIDWLVFFFSGAIVVVVALITVSYQSAKAALSNPIEALRYE
jgi:putative ABC transport system permease protein